MACLRRPETFPEYASINVRATQMIRALGFANQWFGNKVSFQLFLNFHRFLRHEKAPILVISLLSHPRNYEISLAWQFQ
jgi:hypothetical protein